MRAFKTMWVGLAAIGTLGLGACAKPGPAPASASAPIPLTGVHRHLDEVASDKYMHYAVGTTIHATPDTVWQVLTDVEAYEDWNSTLVSLEGEIVEASKLELVAKIAPNRKFKPTVATVSPLQGMVWEDGGNVFKGVRTFTLTPHGEDGTAFTMKEAYTGAMLKMIAKRLPDFGPDFETFAADLKHEAEARQALRQRN